MRPTKLSSNVFLELPPVLAHYLEAGRNVWLESVPNKGKLSMLNRPGVFTDIEALAVERKQWVEMLGLTLARALRYRLGFEQGRRDAARHYTGYAQNSRLALQAGPVFGQLQGRFVVEPVKFEFDLSSRTLYRELVLHSSAEGLSHRMAFEDGRECACWTVAGYLSGQVSEIVGRHVITLETDCCAKGDAVCRFISRLEPEWGPEVDWVRDALKMEPYDPDRPQPTPTAFAPAASPAPSYYNAPDEKDDYTAPEPADPPIEDVEEEFESPAPAPDPLLNGVVAGSQEMQVVVRRLRQLKDSTVPVLLVGEPGTGRHTMARLIHKNSSRTEGPFTVFDCTGLSSEGIVRELFGYAAGAFPGALRDHAGVIARCDGGTLYLEEVTNLPLDAQVRLIRVMEDGAVLPLGGPEPVPVDVRILAATQCDPLEKVADGVLREDLYYALAVGRLVLPPLRDRGTDILRLAERCLQEARRNYDKPDLRFSEEVKQVLLSCPWPGNINQLRNVVEHAVVMGEGTRVGVDDLPEEILAARWNKASQELSEQVVIAALKRTGGNRSKAAEVLGVGRTTLWRAMKRLGLE